VSDNTTPAEASADAGTDWAAKYAGMQRIYGQRFEELTAEKTAHEQTRAENEGLRAQLAEYSAAREAEAQEERDRQAYEALKDRFDESPAVRRPNAPHDSSPRDEERQSIVGATSATQLSKGWPTNR